MNLEEFLIECNLLKVYCDNLKSLRRDTNTTNEILASLDLFYWDKTEQGYMFWHNVSLGVLAMQVQYTQSVLCFLNHPILKENLNA